MSDGISNKAKNRRHSCSHLKNFTFCVQSFHASRVSIQQHTRTTAALVLERTVVRACRESASASGSCALWNGYAAQNGINIILLLNYSDQSDSTSGYGSILHIPPGTSNHAVLSGM